MNPIHRGPPKFQEGKMSRDSVQDHFLRITDLREITGLSRTSIWRLEGAGEFPPRRQLSPGRVGWLRSEVEAWVKNRPRVETR